MCLFLSSVAHIPMGKAQTEEIYSRANRMTVGKYVIDRKWDHVKIGSAFSKDSIFHLPFTDRRVLQIDLVYTHFREQESFDQDQLNLARLRKLIMINPLVAENDFITWNLIGQNACQSSEECLGLYHGFVIYYDKYYTKEETRKEVDSVKIRMNRLEQQILMMDSLIEYEVSSTECTYPELLYSREYLIDEINKYYRCDQKFEGWAFFTVKMDHKGRPEEVKIKGSIFPCEDALSAVLKYVLRWKRGLVIGRQQHPLWADGTIYFPLKKDGIEITRYTIPENLRRNYRIVEKKAECNAFEVDTLYRRIVPHVEKDFVFSVLQKNWKGEQLFVVDVTGSMYPYTSDLLRWIRLWSLEENNTFIFFNDGDDRPTAQKVIGKTGGIYSITSNQIDKIREVMFRAMSNGGGGDLPENNIEALLYGVGESKTDQAWMIADNYAFPRDSQLFQQFNGNLKIILCGTSQGINVQYMDLARKYHISLYTNEAIINDLHQLPENAQVTFGRYRYQLTGRGFQRMF